MSFTENPWSQQDHGEPRPAVSYLVVISRDGGPPEATPFDAFDNAATFFDSASEQWSDSYLTLVIAGPGKPLRRSIDPHCRPDVVAMRRAGSCCVDLECDLSGGYAHVGPCESCECPTNGVRR